jgi:hypothetical protein
MAYDEFYAVLSEAKSGKAAGHDQIPMEIFSHKYLYTDYVVYVLKLERSQKPGLG